MRHSCIQKRKQSFLAQSHLIHNLLRDINKLNNLLLPKPCFNLLLLDLHKLKLRLIALVDWHNHFVHVILNERGLKVEQVIQRVRHLTLADVLLFLGLYLRLNQVDLFLHSKCSIPLVNLVLFVVRVDV